MARKTPMTELFEYFDLMINENIDWFELKKKCLELEANEFEFVFSKVVYITEEQYKDFKDFYEKTYLDNKND
jgi:hypothetical protein